MAKFDVYEEVARDSLAQEQQEGILPTMWVNREKGDSVRARLVCKGCYQSYADKDDTYASTPLLTSLKVLVALSLVWGYAMEFADVSTAFLHASIQEEIFVDPPVEYYPDKKVV